MIENVLHIEIKSFKPLNNNTSYTESTVSYRQILVYRLVVVKLYFLCIRAIVTNLYYEWLTGKIWKVTNSI